MLSLDNWLFINNLMREWNCLICCRHFDHSCAGLFRSVGNQIRHNFFTLHARFANHAPANYETSNDIIAGNGMHLQIRKNGESLLIFQSVCIHCTRHFNVQWWFKYRSPDYRNLPVTRYFSAPKLNVQSNPKLDKIVQFSFYFVWKSLNSEHLKSTFSLKSSPQLQS